MWGGEPGAALSWKAALAGGLALAGASALWAARRRPARRRSTPGGPLPTDFEAYLRNAAANPCCLAEEGSVTHAATSFEAYLRPPAAAAAAAAAAPDAAGTPSAAAAGPPPDSKPVTVLFGTEFGFSKEVAERACERLRAAGPFW